MKNESLFAKIIDIVDRPNRNCINILFFFAKSDREFSLSCVEKEVQEIPKYLKRDCSSDMDNLVWAERHTVDNYDL